MAYHPSLAPAASWSAMMDDLSHHFGENAELDPATADHIRSYLLAHSAEHYDTLVANRLRQTDPADPLRITATPFWQRIHRRISASVFASKQVSRAAIAPPAIATRRADCSSPPPSRSRRTPCHETDHSHRNGGLPRRGLALAAQAAVGPGQQALLDHLADCQAADSAFSGFSAARGKAFFLASQTTGNVDTPSCSTCHTTDPRNTGHDTRRQGHRNRWRFRATPNRFTDLAKVEKWFRRNCNTVIGRECTPHEKGDFIAFMSSL